VTLGLGFGLKAKIFGLGLAARGLDLDLGLVRRDLVNVTGVNRASSNYCGFSDASGWFNGSCTCDVNRIHRSFD